ncbi:hypothetical protein COX67_02335 [Candidatus Falkowbacteria bacterium CG_4_10_14_0_2_um_filter_36_22]|uniref:Uncharacterized protein n=1 Tax=Candidatus Falkowbacteria bacterium CG02_land_8_20_14_3_00_36_14 TaxID=1974560 RepID=A0A2M7DQL2_9BACT|nr:MAG: hypothetical protein COS18_00795 [Candidatus Falkowbacteria bacterium CG02_land_8_20_14_3_00_36_14]PJA10948.1 MAG: hypothetical protein COX67_02335 [Candidatus Falkowbacteria bacterium CG_4_10_14_0_2_um_filter_36_22]
MRFEFIPSIINQSKEFAAKEKLVVPSVDLPKGENCHRCGSAAFSEFRGGLSSPPQAAKCVRTNSRIQH